MDHHLDTVGLSARAYGALRRAGYNTIQQVRRATDEDLLDVRNFGSVHLAEVREKVGRDSRLPDGEPDLVTVQAAALLRLTEQYLARVEVIRGTDTPTGVREAMNRWAFGIGWE